jgi:hypothetical protein
MKKWSALLLGLVLVVPAIADEKPAKEPAAKADPEATQLLADARAARANWEHFPGFSADLEVFFDGKVVKGHAVVNAKGKVEVDLANAGAEAWAKRMLASIAGHRMDSGTEAPTPCAFLAEDTGHPLGRAIRVVNDEYHSSYRVRDRQITEVNRHMKDVRFTIIVLENRRNEEKQFLPACFTVETWDLKTDALRGSETQHQTWHRVGKFDLPATTTVVTATAGKLEARSLKLTNHQLASSAARP